MFRGVITLDQWEGTSHTIPFSINPQGNSYNLLIMEVYLLGVRAIGGNQTLCDDKYTIMVP